MNNLSQAWYDQQNNRDPRGRYQTKLHTSADTGMDLDGDCADAAEWPRDAADDVRRDKARRQIADHRARIALEHPDGLEELGKEAMSGSFDDVLDEQALREVLVCSDPRKAGLAVLDWDDRQQHIHGDPVLDATGSGRKARVTAFGFPLAASGTPITRTGPNTFTVAGEHHTVTADWMRTERVLPDGRQQVEYRERRDHTRPHLVLTQAADDEHRFDMPGWGMHVRRDPDVGTTTLRSDAGHALLSWDDGEDEAMLSGLSRRSGCPTITRPDGTAHVIDQDPWGRGVVETTHPDGTRQVAFDGVDLFGRRDVGLAIKDRDGTFKWMVSVPGGKHLVSFASDGTNRPEPFDLPADTPHTKRT